MNYLARSVTQAPPATPAVENEKKLVLPILLFCAIGSSLLSFLVFIRQSLRLDESQSIWQSSHSIAGLLHTVALDVHVPLYHLILHYWIFFFGNSVVSVRLPSLIFFLATIPVVYLLARKILPVRWSLFAVALFSFSPFLNWYGNEARMYTLLLLVSALNQLFFIKIMKNNKGWFWYGLSALIGAYTHYFFLFNLIAEGIYFILNRNKFAPGTFKRLIIVGGLVIVALSPWLLYFHSLGSASNTRPHLQTPSSVDFFSVYSQFIFGFQDNYVNTIFLSAWPLVMLLALMAVRRSKGISQELSFMATMSVIPVLLAYFGSRFITPFFLSRYMVIAVAPLLLMLIWIFSQYIKKIAFAFAALLIILTALTTFSEARSSATPVKEAYKQVASDININVQPQDLVILSAPFTIYPFEYYYHGYAQIQTLPIWNRAAVGQIPAFDLKTMPTEVATLNAHHHYIYLVLSQDQGYEKDIYQYYLTHFKQISHKTYSPDLSLYVYQVGYYAVPPIDKSPLRVTP